jgi:hypothetical protein
LPNYRSHPDKTKIYSLLSIPRFPEYLYTYNVDNSQDD